MRMDLESHELYVFGFMCFIAGSLIGLLVAPTIMDCQQNKPIIAHCQELCLKADPNVSCIEKCNGETK